MDDDVIIYKLAFVCRTCEIWELFLRRQLPVAASCPQSWSLRASILQVVVVSLIFQLIS